MPDYVAEIKSDSSSGLRDPAISEKLFLTYSPAGLPNYAAYTVRKLAADKLNIPITRVYFCGSSALGVSPHKQTAFNRETSDIDLAIIDASWFTRMLEAAQSVTKGYTDLTPFSNANAPPQFAEYVANKGMVRPDLMPRCQIKSEWMNTFRDVSDQCSHLARKVSGALYLSEAFFISKQCSAVRAVRAFQ